jgi:hypothetical protein
MSVSETETAATAAVATEGAAAVAGAVVNHHHERVRDTIVDKLLEKVMESSIPHSLRAEYEDVRHEIPGLSFGAIATALRKLNHRYVCC